MQQRGGGGAAAKPRAGSKASRRAAGGRAAVPGTRQRDADATRARILEAARTEFARLGLGGARVDEIAERARANKRMIYH
ncbi:TetR family transcriptional regulator, partial [Nostoc sp. NIES-2111]